MKAIGKSLYAVTLATLILLAHTAHAEVTAIVDRDTLSVGESFRLIITATQNEELSTLDLSPLQADFEVLQRTTSSQTNIVNGRRSHTKQLHIDLVPKVEGLLQIPGLRVDNTFTDPIAIKVAPEAEIETGGQALIFEAEVDRTEAYVQSQVLLTLRIMQAVNLDNHTISELELEDAFIKPLEQASFQRTIDGRPWRVYELRYAIFPEKSGTLTIPAQALVAQEVVPRRSFFDLRDGGRRLRRTTEPLHIDILPRPRHFPASTWLPARKVTLEEAWSANPDTLKAGESVTRSVRIKAEGLQGAQLPPTLFKPVDGAKFYPDQPQVTETESAQGLVGVRTDSAALVPTREGQLTLPEIRVPWWDTQAGTVRYAVLPERTIQVAPGELTQVLPPPPAPTPALDTGQIEVRSGGSNDTLWKLIAAISTLGWIATLAIALRSRKPARSKPTSIMASESATSRQRYKAVLKACADNDARRTRAALIDWLQAQATTGQSLAQANSLEAHASALNDEAFTRLCHELDASLYNANAPQWNGAPMAECVKQLRETLNSENNASTATLSLYPQAAKP